MPKNRPENQPGFETQLASGMKRLTGAGRSVLLAVSGGRDSMALLHGVVHLRQSLEIQELVVAHLNHGLRGEFGQRDAELVSVACDALNVHVVILDCKAGELAKLSRGSLEEAARNARYEYLQTLAQQRGLPLIATAHHASDQAETVLHNILRGSGLRGLKGIPERRRLNGSVELIRPMLTIKADVIADYVQWRGIAFTCDETNADNDFTRNRIRHQLIPLLQDDFNVRIADSLVRLAEQSQELLEGLDALADEVLAMATLERNLNVCRLDVMKLQSHAEPVIRHALTVLWIRQDWPRRDLSRNHLRRLTSMLTDGVQSAIDLPGGVRAELRGNLLILQKVPLPR
ncbi:MAG TPA: tRNA lysidine(34) synthetase TilS [Planctomycetaceae bacterium]|nr:tRNA lysidine(34) synthetase TilS [Planctomycetaceae bacterium]